MSVTRWNKILLSCDTTRATHSTKSNYLPEGLNLPTSRPFEMAASPPARQLDGMSIYHTQGEMTWTITCRAVNICNLPRGRFRTTTILIRAGRVSSPLQSWMCDCRKPLREHFVTDLCSALLFLCVSRPTSPPQFCSPSPPSQPDPSRVNREEKHVFNRRRFLRALHLTISHRRHRDHIRGRRDHHRRQRVPLLLQQQQWQRQRSRHKRRERQHQ